MGRGRSSGQSQGGLIGFKDKERGGLANGTWVLWLEQLGSWYPSLGWGDVGDIKEKLHQT